MNEREDVSRRRKSEIERLKPSLTYDKVVQQFTKRFKNEDYFKESLTNNIIIPSLMLDFQNKIYDLKNFYKALEEYKYAFSPKEKIVLIQIAEGIMYNAIKMEELENKERIYKAEIEYIQSEGWKNNQRYIFSFPNNPELPQQVWMITEFAVYGDSTIRPVHGCKIRKDGQPSLKAQYININWDLGVKMEIINKNK